MSKFLIFKFIRGLKTKPFRTTKNGLNTNLFTVNQNNGRNQANNLNNLNDNQINNINDDLEDE